MEPKIFDFGRKTEENYRSWKLAQKTEKCLRDIAILRFFTHPFDFYGEIKHCEQTLSTTLKNSKEGKIYSHPI